MPNAYPFEIGSIAYCISQYPSLILIEDWPSINHTNVIEKGLRREEKHDNRKQVIYVYLGYVK